jgi:hypothetical protein
MVFLILSAYGRWWDQILTQSNIRQENINIANCMLHVAFMSEYRCIISMNFSPGTIRSFSVIEDVTEIEKCKTAPRISDHGLTALNAQEWMNSDLRDRMLTYEPKRDGSVCTYLEGRCFWSSLCKCKLVGNHNLPNSIRKSQDCHTVANSTMYRASVLCGREYANHPGN